MVPLTIHVTGEGLSAAEVAERIREYGDNEITEKKRNQVLAALAYFWGPIPWMIEVAAILSALVRHWPDFAIILTLLVANAVVGFWEEYQAGTLTQNTLTLGEAFAVLGVSAEVMRARRSCRSFQKRNLTSEHEAALLESAARDAMPEAQLGGAAIRFEYVVVPFSVWPAVGAHEFLVAIAPRE